MDNSRVINRVFSRGVINDLLQHERSEVFNCVVHNLDIPKNKTYGELFSDIYTHLSKNQRNEYYYMNTLLNKLLIGIHNVNTTTALSQVHIGKHIADFVMINGEGRVYEVKSELDNFSRLEEQLAGYYKAFSKVSVLSSIYEREKIEQILNGFGDMGNAVGIYVLSENDTIFSKTQSREPQQFNNFLNHTSIFKLLRKREYENLLINHFGKIPDVTSVLHFRTCLEEFKKIPILEAQNLTFRELKNRNQIRKNDFESIQPELKSAVYFSNLYHKLSDINRFLETTYKG